MQMPPSPGLQFLQRSKRFSFDPSDLIPGPPLGPVSLDPNSEEGLKSECKHDRQLCLTVLVSMITMRFQL